MKQITGVTLHSLNITWGSNMMYNTLNEKIADPYGFDFMVDDNPNFDLATIANIDY